MPHVHVYFDPDHVEQDLLDRLKPALPAMVAAAHNKDMPSGERWQTKPGQVFVRQVALHPTDVNAAKLEIVVEPGRKFARVEAEVWAHLHEALRRQKIVPPELMQNNQCCLWLRFSADNHFGFLSPNPLEGV
jgi:hypothetical protein